MRTFIHKNIENYFKKLEVSKSKFKKLVNKNDISAFESLEMFYSAFGEHDSKSAKKAVKESLQTKIVLADDTTVTFDEIFKLYKFNELKRQDDIFLSASEILKIIIEKDYIEYHLLDGISGDILNSDYNYQKYKIPSDSNINPDGTYSFVEIDPVADAQGLYSSGEFKALYSVFRHKISNNQEDLFIKEISDDRTEIRISSTVLTNDQIVNNKEYITEFIQNAGRDIYNQFETKMEEIKSATNLKPMKVKCTEPGCDKEFDLPISLDQSNFFE